MKRRQAREYALQLLFEREFSGTEPDLDAWLTARGAAPEVQEFSKRIFRGTLEHLAEIDAALEEAAEHWVLGRMAAVDRNILRAGTFEIIYAPDVPPAVAMDEAIEIAKKFSTNESAAFINGILDKIAKLKRP